MGTPTVWCSMVSKQEKKACLISYVQIRMISLRDRVTYVLLSVCPGWIDPCGSFSIDIPDLHLLPVFVFLKVSIANLIAEIILSCGRDVYIFLISAQ